MNRIEKFIKKTLSVLNLDQKVSIFEDFDNRCFDNDNWNDLIESIIEEIN